MTDFTPKQRDAIDDPQGSRLLHANAGSGKTSVIVERFVRAVRERDVDPARILAITFTDKAAGELKQRLRERFLEEGDRASARAAETAYVSTIHGFCTRVLRAHPLEAGLDPDFAVLGDAEGRRLRRDGFDAALASFLDQAAEQNEGALELAAAYRPDRLRELIFEVHARLRSAGDTRPALPDVAPAPPPRAARDRLREAQAAAAAQLAGVASAVTVDRARLAIEHCGSLLASLGHETVPDPADLARAAFKAGNATALANPVVREYREARDAYARACADFQATRAVGLLAGLLTSFGDTYAAHKRARNTVDFEDLELLARDLLRDDEGLRDSYADRFELLMVDEFQDTNAVQVSLLELLERDNLFVVGDELQSIYGFRHADVSIFQDRRRALEAAGRTALLTTNFRSRRELLDVLNATFETVFDGPVTPLRAGRAAPPPRAPLVELLVTDTAGWDDAAHHLGTTLPPAKAWRHAEARLLAQRVSDLVAAEEVRPGEVAVLLRAATDLGVYERALADRGLATYVSGGAGYWSRRQVQDLVAYLAALANPRDELRMLELLASPLAGVSSDGLALLAQARRKLGRDLWWTLEQAFVAGGDGSGDLASRLPDADAVRLRSFCAWFAAERRAAPRHALDELIERAVTTRGYDLHTLRLPDGARRMANVRKLLRLAREFEAQEGRDVRAFIDWVWLADELGTREGEAPIDSEDMEAVRLMTIHAAKGLEFDTVCVADLGRPPRGDLPDLLVDGGEVGLRLASLDGEKGTKALAYEKLSKRRAEADFEEERRIFYVAMTRARERLIISGAIAIDGWPSGPGAPALSWIGPAVAPGIDTLLSTERPLAEIERDFDGRRAAVVCSLNSPVTVGDVLRVEP
ncbi:MAG TPA: UvrD-helicase domain-containing protein, partial [Solirubrobacteraceae bacterium]